MKYIKTIFLLSIAVLAVTFMSPSAAFALDTSGGNSSSVAVVTNPSTTGGNSSSASLVSTPAPTSAPSPATSPATTGGNSSSASTVTNPSTTGGNSTSAATVNPSTTGGNSSSASTVTNPSTTGGNSSSAATVTNPSTTGGNSSSASTVTPPPTPPANTGGGSTGGTTAYGGGSTAFGGGSSSGSYLGTSTLPLLTNIGDCDYLTSYLKIDHVNPPIEVTKLQNFLKFNEGMNIAVTGIFDQATFNAVSAFQVKYTPDVLTPWGISGPTGYVYYTTKKKINELYCKKTFALTRAQIAEIEAYRTGVINGSHSAVTGDVGLGNPTNSTTTPGSTLAHGTTTDNSQVGAVAKTSIASRIWNFIKRIFGR